MNSRLQRRLALAMMPLLLTGTLAACQRAGEDRGGSSGASSGGSSSSGGGMSGESSGGTSGSKSKSSQGDR
jgi:uncharacterized membrane protein YgcG